MGAIVAVSVAAVLLGACGGATVAGPSPVADVPSPSAVIAPAASGLPATFDPAAVAALGLDPDYVRDLVYTAEGAQGRFVHALETWDGRAMHVCAGPGVDSAKVAAIAAQVAAAPIAIAVTPGPCNVTFELDPSVRHTQAERTFQGRSIVAARIPLAKPDDLDSAGLHELGHVLGLGHSPRRDDVMSSTDYGDRPRDFTSRELAVLALIYPKTK